MIRIKILDMLNEEDRSLNWLANKTGLTYSTLYNFAHQRTNAVTYDVLEKLCIFFKCEVGDIIEHVEE